MFYDDEIMEFCIRHRITVEQYFLLYLTASRDYVLPVKQSICTRYLEVAGQFTGKIINDLEEKGLLINLNSRGEYFFDMLMLSDRMKELFATEDMGEELWEAYPVTFPLYDKQTKFLARTGEDKQVILAEYLKRIKYNAKKHAFVLEQLEVYKDLVSRGLINGYKISDWVRMELWDSIARIKEEGGSFGTDI